MIEDALIELELALDDELAALEAEGLGYFGRRVDWGLAADVVLVALSTLLVFTFSGGWVLWLHLAGLY
jgi:hypothetical protein